MAALRKKLPAKIPPPAAHMIEDIIGCKWSLIVLDLVTRGVARPGVMQREVPPHVEYRLTALGKRFGDILERIAALDRELGPGN